ncbi:hypothetical protein Mlab_0257 [Methanocorpusculum labreanum Z]|uniref:Uncharacterized protein n=1 Tax=Methanocorpusculum labreanum (strain ATCC 43576 / DSM 4855 / Z) TaxID=410358 RepID=A2SQ27_METLZ|nr:hypothetical protein [Methanocorpusculum labreanum]ABN06433.1 hypothetical protein Mlab_0257 [Methanocorpusculum labreanum Z]
MITVRGRLIIALSILGVIIAGFAVAEYSFATYESDLPDVVTTSKQILTADDFTYGPVNYRPGYLPIPIYADSGLYDSEDWIVLFAAVNETPVNGNPFLVRPGSVKIDYAFENLTGTAVFQVYGLRYDSGQTWTTHQFHSPASGYRVIASPQSGTLPDLAEYSEEKPLIVSVSNLYYSPDGDMEIGVPFALPFPKDEQNGLSALHLTVDPDVLRGQVTTTSELNGTFYITYTGGDTVRRILLMLAVNSPQTDDFSFTFMSSFVPREA